MTTAERIKENEKRNEARINGEIDKSKMAYKIKDIEGNVFCFKGIENGFPVYRTHGGSKHIFDLTGYEVIEQHIVM